MQFQEHVCLILGENPLTERQQAAGTTYTPQPGLKVHDNYSPTTLLSGQSHVFNTAAQGMNYRTSLDPIGLPR